MKTWRSLDETIQQESYSFLISPSPKNKLINKNSTNMNNNNFQTPNFKLWIPILLENGVLKDFKYRYLLVANESKLLEEEYYFNNIPHLSPDQMAENIYKYQIKRLQYLYIYRSFKLCDVGKKPMVFVTHSMGGLILKKILLLALNKEDKVMIE